MNEKRFIVFIVIFCLLILTGGIYFSTNNTKSTAISLSKNAKLQVGEKSFNLGNIKYKGGIVTKTFIIKNSGTDILKLSNIKTSCHCTRAQIDINGQLSSYFGMSGSSAWIGEVLPGKEAKIIVTFDPAYHGINGIGPISRYVSLETNDIGNPYVEFFLKGVVIR